MNKETGGPAFPCENIVARNENGQLYGNEISSGGMTLRDYFAAKAMQASFGALMGVEENLNQVTTKAVLLAFAKEAYSMADAMLEARK